MTVNVGIHKGYSHKDNINLFYCPEHNLAWVFRVTLLGSFYLPFDKGKSVGGRFWE